MIRVPNKKRTKGIEAKPFSICMICHHVVYVDASGVFPEHDENYGDITTKPNCLGPQITRVPLLPMLALSAQSMANAY